MARSKQQQEPATQVVIYKGKAFPDRHGEKYSVPVTVANKGAWLDSKFREEEARRAAEAEREQRDAEVLRDRQAKVIAAERRQQAQAEYQSELAAIRSEMQGLKGELSTPDAEHLVAMNSSTVVAMGRTLDAVEKVDNLLERLDATEAKCEMLRVEAEAAREVSLKLLEHQQLIINGTNEHHGQIINDLRAELDEAKQVGIDLSSQINQNWETVQNAAKIRESLKEQVAAQTRELMNDMYEGFLSSLNLALGALGLTQEDLDRELVKQRQDQFSKVPLVTSEFLAMSVEVARKTRAAREDAERRTNIASAQSAPQIMVAGPFKTIDRPGFKRSLSDEITSNEQRGA